MLGRCVLSFGLSRSLFLFLLLAFSARGEIPPPQGDVPGHQPSEEHVEGLTAKPFWNVTDNPDLFPWAAGLEANADVVAKEFEEKLARDQELFASDSAWQNQVMGQG